MKSKQQASCDYHVHCGQFRDKYYSPDTILCALHKNGVKKVWISSTTSCIQWKNSKEKEDLLWFIEKEIEEACELGRKYEIDVLPLYWVIPQRHFEGDTIAKVMDGSLYCGFKVQPIFSAWSEADPAADQLFDEICCYAAQKSLPILIHTGEDSNVRPRRFERFFKKYPNVHFVLAHCKQASEIIKVFKQYPNTCGDTAFCPADNYQEICRAGFADRMQMGTDFPITNWFAHMGELGNADAELLTEEYRQTLESLNEMVFKTK